MKTEARATPAGCTIRSPLSVLGRFRAGRAPAAAAPYCIAIMPARRRQAPLSGPRPRDADQHYALLPRVLVDTRARSTAKTLLGSSYSLPVGIAPMGISRTSRFQGDLVLAQAARDEQALMVASADLAHAAGAPERGGRRHALVADLSARGAGADRGHARPRGGSGD